MRRQRSVSNKVYSIRYRGRNFGNSIGPSQSYDFTTETIPSGLTFTRAGSADYINSSGAWATASTDVPRYDYTLGERLLLIEEARTNYLLNSLTPATQTTGSLGTGTYVLWCEGTGSVTSSAGTATATGYGTATHGVPNLITVTGAGTINVTVTGSLTLIQLENGVFPTSRIQTAGATVTRAQDRLSGSIFASFNASQGTLVAEGAIRGYKPGSSTPPLVSLDAGISGNNSLIQLRTDSNGLLATRMLSGTTSVYGAVGTTWGKNVLKRLAISYISGNTTPATDGDLMATSSTSFSDLTNFTTIRIGTNANNGSPYTGWVKSVEYYNTRLSDAQTTNLSIQSTNLRFIATRGRMPDALDTTNKQYNSRSHHIARDNISELTLYFPNWYYNRAGSKNETGSGGTATITASVEYPAGVFTQVKFNLNPSIVLQDGEMAIGKATVSIANGETFWVREFRTSSAGSTILDGTIWDAGDYSNGERFEYAASGLTDKTLGGTIADTGGSAPRSQTGPIAVLGVSTRPSVLILGDSRARGANDTFDSSGDMGEIARSIGPEFGYTCLGSYGNTTQQFITSAGHRLQVKLGVFCSHVICEYGINDISNGGTFSDVQTRLQTIWNYFPTKKVSQSTLTPVTASSDNFTTTANQSFNTGAKAVKDSINDYIRTQPSPLWVYHEVADVVESSRNSGLWKADGVTPNLYTSDGGHGNQYANLQIVTSGAIDTDQFVV